jgi:hypothetical protein
MNKTIAALVLVAVSATAAHAQPGQRLALGAGIGFHDYADKSFSSKNPSVVPEYHIGLTPNGSREGLRFGWKGSIGYSNPDRSDFIGGLETKSGNLRMIPLMAGAGPSYRTGPLSIGVGVVAGPSFNKFSIDDAARAAYRDRLGATLNSIEVQNSLAVRPDASLWYNFAPWVGLHSSVTYTINRPMVKTTVNGVTTSTRWKTDRLGYQAGLAFGVF